MGLCLPSSATLELVAEEGGWDFVEAGWMLAQTGAVWYPDTPTVAAPARIRSDYFGSYMLMARARACI